VFNPSTLAFPIARIILMSLVSRTHPSSARIRSPRVVPLMPFVMSSGWIPIPLYPNVALSWISRHRSIAPGLRRRTNVDAE
jgi:hypothetical protein